jgi:hypothetical protein
MMMKGRERRERRDRVQKLRGTSAKEVIGAYQIIGSYLPETVDQM